MKISLFNTPQLENFLSRLQIITVIFLPCLLFRPILDNDTYWLINTGKYIISHGFPTIEPFTIHEGLAFSIQQWLSTVVFYLIHDFAGKTGLYIFAMIFYFIICYLIYLTALEVSCNQGVSLVLTLFAGVILSFSMVLRPQIFSLFIFTLEIYILELYVEKRRMSYLCWLPFLSLLLINFHSAMWVFFFLLIIPYVIEGFKFKFSGTECQKYRNVPLVICGAVSFGAGFLNPYGMTNMFYVFRSYGSSYLNAYIGEMSSPDFKSFFGIAVFEAMMVVFASYFLSKQPIRIRYLLISVGTLFMGLSSLRSIPIFICCSFPLTAYYLKHLKFTINLKPYMKAASIILSFCFFAYLMVNKQPKLEEFMSNYCPAGAVEYIETHTDAERIRLYNDFNVGGYIEYCGIRTFIDSRAEVFLKSNNKKADIIADYLSVYSGKAHYNDVFKKYSFTHILLCKSDFITNYISQDSHYEKIYEDDKFILYQVVI